MIATLLISIGILIVIALVIGVAFDMGAGHQSSSPSPVVRTQPPPPEPAPSPEPSCFALGVARSIREEPDQWEAIPDVGYHSSSYWSALSVRHRVHGTLLTASTTYITPTCTSRLDGCTRLSSVTVWDANLSNADTLLLAQTIEAHPLGQLKDAIERERTEVARKAAAQAHFTSLGCPPPSP